MCVDQTYKVIVNPLVIYFKRKHNSPAPGGFSKVLPNSIRLTPALPTDKGDRQRWFTLGGEMAERTAY